MARIINPGRVPITVPTLHVVPAQGFVEVDNATLRECMRGISGAVLAGQLSVEWDEEEELPVDLPPPAPRKKAKAARTEDDAGLDTARADP